MCNHRFLRCAIACCWLIWGEFNRINRAHVHGGRANIKKQCSYALHILANFLAYVSIFVDFVAVAEQNLDEAPLVQFDASSSGKVEAYAGQLVELPCNVSEPAQVLRWLYNDAVVASEITADYDLSANGSLLILSFRNELKGSYRCIASADGGVTKQVARVIVVTSFGE